MHDLELLISHREGSLNSVANYTAPQSVDQIYLFFPIYTQIIQLFFLPPPLFSQT